METIFEKVPSLGKLILINTYLFYDEPVLFSCSDMNNNIYLAVKENENEYLLAQTNKETLTEAEENRLTIRDLIQKSKNTMIYHQNRQTLTYVNAGLLPNSQLPEKGAFLN